VPAVAIAVAAAALRLRSRAVTALIVLAIAGALGSSAVQQIQPYKYENFRAATDLVVDDARPGDGVLFLPSSMRVGYDAYVRPTVTTRTPRRWRTWRSNRGTDRSSRAGSVATR
jgi:hypothetical protein